MKKTDMEMQALAALHKAAEAETPADKTDWLKVAQIWYDIYDGTQEPKDVPEAPTGFVKNLPECEGENVRLYIRVRADGTAQVICDRRFAEAFGHEASSPGEAAALAMDMLDKE